MQCEEAALQNTCVFCCEIWSVVVCYEGVGRRASAIGDAIELLLDSISGTVWIG